MPTSLPSSAPSFLYPADPLDPRRVDAYFRVEAARARSLGARVFLLDHDALVRGESDLATRKVPHGSGWVWYRGWMIPSGHYDRLQRALRQRGCDLWVTASQYRSAHELPGWYATFAALTPASVWHELAPGEVPNPEDLAELVRPLPRGAGVVKDFVKSRKHEWERACFVADLADTRALHRVVSTFIELQGQFLAGGIVVRAFEPLDGPTGTAQARVWWLDGEPVLVGPHPDTPKMAPTPPLEPFAAAVARLGCPFVTTDLARRADGVWRLVEVGDGQVSDRPATVEPEALLGPLVSASR